MTARRGLSAVEVVLGIALLAALFIPVYGLFVTGRESAVKSRLAYLAMLAAREEIADLRILASLPGRRVPELAHGWTPLRGNLLDRLAPLARPVKGLDYPAEYERIQTRLDVAASADGKVYPATLHARWQEHGEALGERELHDREGTTRFDFLLVAARRDER